MRIIPLTLVLLFSSLISPLNPTTENTSGSFYYHGIVLEIIEDTIDEDNLVRRQVVKTLISNASIPNREIIINHQILLTSIDQIIVEPNDKIIVWAKSSDTNFEYCRIYSYTRDNYLAYLLVIFIFVILLIGGKNGLSSIISLLITLALVFMMFFPMIVNDYNPLISAILVCILSTLITLLIIGKSDIKTYSALLGTLSGILIAGLLTYLFGMLTNIQGVSDDSAELLSYIPQGHNFNFKELLFAGILIGSLGAIMDVTMSISSAMDEVVLSYSRISNVDLFKSGMRIGKDIMGTMTNTLILAYVGSSMNVLLVFYLYELSFVQFINSDQIASEILRSLSGSIGLVLSIPLTTLSYILIRNEKDGITNSRSR